MVQAGECSHVRGDKEKGGMEEGGVGSGERQEAESEGETDGSGRARVRPPP
jgi:hypothetical protein